MKYEYVQNVNKCLGKRESVGRFFFFCNLKPSGPDKKMTIEERPQEGQNGPQQH